MDHRYEIRHIAVWPATKLAFVLFLIVGILMAILYAAVMAGLGFLASALGPSAFGDDFGIIRNLGLFMIPLVAIIYAVFGTVATVILTVLYNLVASVLGGVVVSLRPVGGRAVGAPVPPLHFADREESGTGGNA